MTVEINEQDIIKAAGEGMDAFLELFYKQTMDTIGGELNDKTMRKLEPDQITLLAYMIFREEVMGGGFVQLIHNGYGPFIFLNPFAKAMRLWGCRDFCNLVYKGRKLFEKYGKELRKDCTYEEFMAMFEQYPEFDDLDDEFVEMEEEVSAAVAHYVDDNIETFAKVITESQMDDAAFAAGPSDSDQASTVS